jgi:hypothetical protein
MLPCTVLGQFIRIGAHSPSTLFPGLNKALGPVPKVGARTRDLKGTVARDFWPLFFCKSTSYGLQIHTLNYFRIRCRLGEHIRKGTFISVVGDSAESKKLSS